MIFVLLVMAVAYLALTPAPPAGMDLGWDKLNHVAAFGALAFAGLLSCPGSRSQRVAVFLGLLAYGGAIEILQLFVPGRACEWRDLLADAAGIAVGAGIAAHALRVAARRSANF
jgi:VanZ family protein